MNSSVRLDRTMAQLCVAVWVARSSVCCAILGCQIGQVVMRILFSGWIMPLCAPYVSDCKRSTWIEQAHTDMLRYTAEKIYILQKGDVHYYWWNGSETGFFFLHTHAVFLLTFFTFFIFLNLLDAWIITGPPVTSILCINPFSLRMFFYTQLRMRLNNLTIPFSTLFSDLLMFFDSLKALFNNSFTFKEYVFRKKEMQILLPNYEIITIIIFCKVFFTTINKGKL